MKPKSVDKALLNYLEDAEKNGEASRDWLMVGRMLTVCQRCPKFHGADCDDFLGKRFRVLLISKKKVCEAWWRLHNASRTE